MLYNNAVSTGESLRLPYQASVELVMYKWYARKRTNADNAARGKEGELFLVVLPYKAISRGKHRLYSGIGVTVETKLERISQVSTEHPEMVFTPIGYLIDKELLADYHKKMDRDKGVGIEGPPKMNTGERWKRTLTGWLNG